MSASSPAALDSRPRSALRRLAAGPLAGPALLFVICCCFSWKLALSSDYTWIDDPDSVHMDVPRLQFQWTTWQDHHQFPLWDPHLWCGQPFLGEIVGAAYPLNWPFFFAPLPETGHVSYGQLNWYFFILHFLGALFAYFLCRELGTSKWAAILGGFAFAYTGFFGLTRWPEVLSSLLLAPLVLLFQVRALRGYRPLSSAALCGMFLGLAWLSGHHEIPVYISFTVAGVWLWHFIGNRAELRRSVMLAAVTFLFAGLTGAFQILPGYEYAKLAVRWAGVGHPVGWGESIPYFVHAAESFPPSALPAIIVPFLGGNALAFTGVVLLALAAIAVFCRWTERWVRLFTSVALAGLLLALGGWDILHGVLYAVLPMFEKARNPNRLVCLFDLGIAVLAAFGLDWLRSGALSLSFRVIRRTAAGLGVLLFAVATVARIADTNSNVEALFMTALIALLLAAVLAARDARALSGVALSVALIGLAFIELGNVSPAVFREIQTRDPQSFLPELTKYRDIADFLRRQPGPVRVDTVKAMDAFNFGDWYGIDTLNGFGAGLTHNVQSLDWPNPHTQDLLGVGYSVSKAATRPDQQLVFHSSSGFNVYRNLNAFPRVWIVHRTEHAGNDLAVQYRLDDPAFDGRTTALFEGSAPSLQTCSGNDEAHVVSRSANSVIVDVRAACHGMVVLADTWYPGWGATVDDRPERIWPADNALRGVVVGAGMHRIEFRYRPASAIAGGVLSMIGILGACLLAWRDRARKV